MSLSHHCAVVEVIANDDNKRHLAGIVSGLDIRYDVGEGDHPLLGRRIPPRGLTTSDGETSTPELLHDGAGVLLDLTDDPGIRAVAAGWSDRVKTTSARETGTSSLGDSALLVRPDGYVAWAGDDAKELDIVLRRWFGNPTDIES